MNEEMTVSDLFEAWLESKKVIVQPVTYKHYRSKYRLYLEKPFGKRKVNDITPEQWRDFENSLSTTKGIRGNTLSLPIIRKLLTLYHTVFDYGKTEFGLNDPTGDNYVPEQSLSSESVFSSQEVEQLKAAVKPYNVHHLCIMLCIYTGVTSGEICAIKWGDIDTDRKL
ncbi:MAG: tyrosine-type recombinase/integrase family protein, partial [Ruminococcus sp.]|nr:tyrosine-type recombinase/integrase family protein [Ruminococcus sp.]